MSKFLPTSRFKWIDLKECDLNKYICNKYTSNSSKGFVLEVDFEYPKELQELDNDYLLAPDKIEIKREMLPEYQLKIADLYNIPIGNIKKLVPNVLDSLLELAALLEARIKTKKIHRVLEFSQPQWLKLYIEFNTEKRTEAEKK